jgi:hypothetical protein
MIIYVENFKDGTKQSQPKFSNIPGHKVKKSADSYTPIMNNSKGKLRKQFHLHRIKKNKIFTN